MKDATGSSPALLSGSVNSTSFVVQGRISGLDRHDDINRLVIVPGFFEVMGIPVLTGRTPTRRDDDKAPKVAVINEAAVRKYFPVESPLGHRFGSSPEENAQFEIVGVVRNTKYDSVRDDAPPDMMVLAVCATQLAG